MRLSTYARLAVRLANTVQPAALSELRGARPDTLTSVDDIPALFVEPPVWQVVATPTDVAKLRQLRTGIRAVFADAAAGEEAAAVRRLNELLDTVTVRPRVTDHGGDVWHMHLNEDAESVFDGFASVAVVGLAAYLVDFGIERLGVCAAPPCTNVFLDSSSNLSRRYCSDRCASRANVAAYRARLRSD